MTSHFVGRTQFAPTNCRERPKCRSANLPTCWGGGTRKARDGGVKYIKIYGRVWTPASTTGRRIVAPYNIPTHIHYSLFIFHYTFISVPPLHAVILRQQPKNLVSHLLHFALFEILRFAQDDKRTENSYVLPVFVLPFPLVFILTLRALYAKIY